MESSVKKVAVLFGSLLLAFNLVSCSCSNSDSTKHKQKKQVKKTTVVMPTETNDEEDSNKSSSYRSKSTYTHGSSGNRISGTFKNYDGHRMTTFKEARRNFHPPRRHHKR